MKFKYGTGKSVKNLATALYSETTNPPFFLMK